ncbi:MAG: VOC family protein [Patescibacteria group bacterium]
MTPLSPFIKFNNSKCREAMTFYKECLGGELEFMVIKDSPMAKDMPEDKLDLIMHSTLTGSNWMLIGSDMMQDKATIGDSVGVSFSCQSEEEIRSIFNKLADGGDVFMPVEEQFWGALFGVVTDKYGVEWMLNFPNK